jgi:hypothetical protein
MINKAGTVSPTKGPAMYQGQGCLINSKISIFVVLLMQICFFKSSSYVTFVTQGKKNIKNDKYLVL